MNAFRLLAAVLIFLLLQARSVAQNENEDIAMVQETQTDLLVARSAYELGEWEIAVEAYEAAKHETTFTIGDLHQLSYALLQLDRYDRARAVLENILDIDPADALAWFNLGITHMRTNRMHAAHRCFERTAEFTSEDPSVWVCLAITSLCTDRFAQAWGAFDELLALDEEKAEMVLGWIVAEEDAHSDPAADW
ncbi:MAG: tetratricopeptide repeat protein [Bacteroidetes bacterium]|nr:tetratricopeptide repeat protein [Bacteroidota bacterium]